MGQPAGLHHWDHVSMIGSEFVGPFLSVDEVSFRFPRVVLRGVAYPADEVLWSFVVVVEDLFDCVFFVVFFDICRWGVYAVPRQVYS